MSEIHLDNNQIRTMDPQMFSHLNYLYRLDLRGNVCTSNNFDPVISKKEIEKELAKCGVGQESHEEVHSLDKTCSEKIVDDKVSERNEETCENIMNEKLEIITNITNNIRKSIETNNEENAKEIREIKTMVEKIFQMLK